LAVGSISMAPAGAGHDGCVATVSDTTPSPGQTVTVDGSGAADGGSVSATLDGAEVGSGTADAEGTFSFSATIPSSASGDETLEVSCGAGRGVASVSLTVSASGSGQLPATGSSSTAPMTTVGLAAVALGGAALGAARWRTRAVARARQ
jgi:LPXTG-motif cell wall-anchored protein